MSIIGATTGELLGRLERGELTSVELTTAYLDRIAAVDDAGPRLNAVLASRLRAVARFARKFSSRHCATTRRAPYKSDCCIP